MNSDLYIIPGNPLGWGVNENGVLMGFGSYDLYSDTEPMTARCTLRFLGRFREITGCHFNRVFCKDVSPGSTHYQHSRKVIEAWCFGRGTPLDFFGMKDVKRVAVGPLATPRQILKAAQLRWPDADIKTQEGAEAVWSACFGVGQNRSAVGDGAVQDRREGRVPDRGDLRAVEVYSEKTPTEITVEHEVRSSPPPWFGGGDVLCARLFTGEDDNGCSETGTDAA